MAPKLLTRDEFREGVFARDKHQCVICGRKSADGHKLDAHHILERRLWPDGGYYLENGASVCSEHHIAAENTTLGCDELRAKCGIRRVILPPQFYPDEVVDKWGNPILPSGMRIRGELFGDASVQKILEPVLHLFSDRVKYPRTYHLPWSAGLSNDDRVLPSLEGLEGQEVVVTAKMDGECTTMARDYMHARSLTYDPHPSRSIVAALHGQIRHEIPEGMRLCGENLYATHSIHYEHLAAYFELFSVWNDKNVALSWDDTVEWAALLELETVPVMYRGPWNEMKIRGLIKETFQNDPCEGYVVRVTAEIPYGKFRTHVGKYVRKNHVQTDEHWKSQPVVPNKLKTKE